LARPEISENIAVHTLHQIATVVAPARRRRSLATMASLAQAACLATILPFAVGIARPDAPDRPRAPRGGIEVAGRFYRGGSFLPASSPATVVDDAEGPAWTWDAWTDADTWELGPEPAPVAFLRPELFADAPAGQEWVAISPTLGVLRDVERIAREPEPEDTRDHAVAFTPSRSDELYRLGYELGLDREDARLDVLDAADIAEFRSGYLAGKAEWDARLEEMCGSAEYSKFSNRITDRDAWPMGCMS
jgi:hypothetical protein